MSTEPAKRFHRLEWIALFYIGMSAILLASGLIFSLNLLNEANDQIRENQQQIIKALNNTEHLISNHIPLMTSLNELTVQVHILKTDLDTISLDYSLGNEGFLKIVENLERLALELELLIPDSSPARDPLLEAILTLADIADEASVEVVINNLRQLHQDSLDPITEANKKINEIKSQLGQQYIDILYSVSNDNIEIQKQLKLQENIYRQPIFLLSVLIILLLLMPLLLVTLLFYETSKRIKLLEHYADGIALEKFYSPPFDSKDRTGSLARTLGALSSRVKELLETTRIQAREAKYQAHHDYLTSLPNRRNFVERLIQDIHHQVTAEKPCCLFFIDLDQFKDINDTLGHDAGDELIQIIGKRLLHALSPKDFIARLGGDEFAAIICCQERDVTNISVRLLKQIRQPFELKEQTIEITASIGVTRILPNSSSKVLLKQADIALYAAKQSGRNKYQLFEADLEEGINRRVALIGDLRRALEKEQFELYLQPKVDIVDGSIVGVETLIRWAHPEKGLVSPFEFIPLAESCGLILPIGEWVLREACVIANDFHQRGYQLMVAINCSGQQLTNKRFVERFTSIIKDEEFPLDMLELEVTESELMESMEESTEKLLALRELGIKVAIDDFGTGYSSLRYLKDLPVNTIKIDRSFVISAEANSYDAAIIQAIVSLGSNLNLDVIAEGVETQSQLKLVHDLGVRHVQGYIYAKPMPLSEFDLMLNETKAQQNNWRADVLIAEAV